MDDITALQAVINRSIARAGPSLRRNFELPEHGLNARQIITYWGTGHQQVAPATVTAKGEPRVAPVGAILRAPPSTSRDRATRLAPLTSVRDRR